MNETPMSDIESQLRLLMNIAASEPPRRIRGQAVRRKAVRRRTETITAAAAAAVVLAGGVAVAAVAQPGGPPQPSGHTQPPVARISASTPRYYVVGRTTSRGNETEVRATATGAVRATVRCPWPVPNVRPWPVAPASNQTFFLVCQRATRPVGYATFLESRIYRFRVSSTGRVTGYTPVRGGSLPGLRVAAVAATPDSSTIAAIVYPGSLANLSPKSPGSILVINTRTGTHAIWHAAPPVPGKVVYYPQAISLTADGHELAFLTEPQCFGSHCTMPPGTSQQIRVVNPAVNGQLNNSRVLIRLSSVLRLSAAAAVAAVISPDGSTLTLEVVGNLSGRPLPQSVSVVQVPITGHRRLRFIYQLVADNGSYGYSFFSADPATRHFLIGVGLDEMIAGRIDDRRLIPLKPAGYQVAFEVW